MGEDFIDLLDEIGEEVTLWQVEGATTPVGENARPGSWTSEAFSVALPEGGDG
jgi:hypothetical protein